MTRLALLVVFAVACVAVTPSPAFAKGGPTEASVTGPGIAGSITLDGGESGGPLGELVDNAGFFPAVFSQDPSPMLERAPVGDLGPRYVVTYVLPGPYGEEETVRQDLYPYAEPEPVSYMAPGQSVLGTETRGGWYVATSQVKETLVAAGLPENAPTDTGGSSFPWTLTAFVALAAVGLAVALLLRRRVVTPATPAS